MSIEAVVGLGVIFVIIAAVVLKSALASRSGFIGQHPRDRIKLAEEEQKEVQGGGDTSHLPPHIGNPPKHGDGS